MDKAKDLSSPAMGIAKTAISIRNGPVEEMDVDKSPMTNGHANGKRSRTSTGKSYKEASGSDDEDEPLVSYVFHGCALS